VNVRKIWVNSPKKVIWNSFSWTLLRKLGKKS